MNVTWLEGQVQHFESSFQTKDSAAQDLMHQLAQAQEELEGKQAEMNLLNKELDECRQHNQGGQQAYEKIAQLEGSLQVKHLKKTASYETQSVNSTRIDNSADFGDFEMFSQSAHATLREKTSLTASVAELKQRCIDLQLERDDLSDTVDLQTLLIEELRERETVVDQVIFPKNLLPMKFTTRMNDSVDF